MKIKLIKKLPSKNVTWYYVVNEYYDFKFIEGDFFISDKHGNVRLCLNEEEVFEYFESGEALRKIREAKFNRVLKKKIK